MLTTYTRPFKPTDLQPSLFESYSLLAMAKRLATEEGYAKNGRDGLTLVRGDNLTMVLMALRKGTVVAEHRAPGPATVVILSGKILFRNAKSGETPVLEQGCAVTFAADVTHGVEAAEDSVFLVIIGKS